MGYRKKTRAELVYDANKKRIRAEGAILLADLLNEALAVMTERFEEALLEGRLLEMDGNRDLMREYLREASVRQLGTGK